MQDILIAMLVKGTGLLLLAVLGSVLLQRRTAATRHLVWAVAFAGLAVLPFMVWLMPVREIRRSMPVMAPSRISVMSPVATSVSAVAPVIAVQPMTPRPEPKAPFPWEQFLVGIWALGAAGSLVSMGLRLAAARRLVQRSQASEYPALVEASNLAGSDLSRQVRLSDEVPVPMTLGYRRPVILLPLAAVDWPCSTLVTVLRHELAHIRRHDWAAMIGARAVRSFYWFHPLAWWAEAQMRAESEAAADDLVLLAGTDAPTYAEDLVTLASSLSYRPMRTEALAVVERGTLKTRVNAILSKRQRGGPVRGHVAMPVLLGTLAVLSIFACSRLVKGPDTVSDGRYYLGNGHWVEILAITDMHGTPRSWNAHGQLMREPLPVTGFARSIDNDNEGHPRPMDANTRYVIFRTDMDGDVGLETSLSADGDAHSGTFYEYEAPKGYGYQFYSVFGGSVMVQRFDFPASKTGAVYAWSPSGPYKPYGSLANGDMNMSMATDGSGMTTLHTTLPAEFSSLQVMGEATAGKEVLRSQMPRYVTGKQSVTFYVTTKQAITQVRLLARPVKSVLFENIPLEPKEGAGVPNDVADLPGLKRFAGNIATLSDGSRIEFVGLADAKEAGAGMWGIDGKPLPKDVLPTYFRAPRDETPNLPTDRTINIVLRRPKLSAISSYELYDGSGIGFRLHMTTDIATPDATNLVVHSVVVDAKARETAVVWRSPVGPYRKIDGGPLTATGRYARRFVPGSSKGERQDVLHVAIPADVLGKLQGKDSKFEILDAKGKPVPFTTMSSTSIDGDYGFYVSAAQAKNVVSIQVSARPYEYLEFPNVHLYPNR